MDPRVVKKSRSALGKLPKIIKLFRSLYGPYPFGDTGAVVDHARHLRHRPLHGGFVVV